MISIREDNSKVVKDTPVTRGTMFAKQQQSYGKDNKQVEDVQSTK